MTQSETAAAVEPKPSTDPSPAVPIPQPNTLCQVCTTNPHKYRCPGCSTRTCSLSCVQSHKSATNCSGQRNKTQYVPLQHYNENTLFSDYSLLEDTARTADNAARNRHSGPLHKVAKPTQFKLPVKLHKLQLAAGKRGTRVRFMSRGMKRAEDNASYVDFATEVVHWTVEVHLPIAEADSTSTKVLLTTPVPESDSVASLASAFADPTSAASLAHPAAHVAMSALLSAVPPLPLHYYWRRPNPIRGQPDRLHVPIGDPSMSIKDALNRMPVLEYPVLVVTRAPLAETELVLAAERQCVDEDEDVAMEPSGAEQEAASSDDDDSPPEEASSSAPSSSRPAPQTSQPQPPVPSFSAPLPPPPRAPARAHASLPAKPATLPPLPSSAPSSTASSPTAAPRAAPPPTAAAPVASVPWRTPTWSANPYSSAPPQSQSHPPSLSGWGAASSTSHAAPSSSSAAPAPAPPAATHPLSASAKPVVAPPVSLAGWGAPSSSGGLPKHAAPQSRPPSAAAGMPSSDQVLALWQQLATGQQEQVQRALAADFGGSSK